MPYKDESKRKEANRRNNRKHYWNDPVKGRNRWRSRKLGSLGLTDREYEFLLKLQGSVLGDDLDSIRRVMEYLIDPPA